MLISCSVVEGLLDRDIRGCLGSRLWENRLSRAVPRCPREMRIRFSRSGSTGLCFQEVETEQKTASLKLSTFWNNGWSRIIDLPENRPLRRDRR